MCIFRVVNKPKGFNTLLFRYKEGELNMKYCSPLLVFINRDYVIEISDDVDGPIGLKYNSPRNGTLTGFYIAYLPKDPDHMYGSEKYQNPDTRFDPVDIKKLARMPELIAESKELLSKLPSLYGRIPNYLLEAKTNLELKLTQL